MPPFNPYCPDKSLNCRFGVGELGHRWGRLQTSVPLCVSDALVQLGGPESVVGHMIVIERSEVVLSEPLACCIIELDLSPPSSDSDRHLPANEAATDPLGIGFPIFVLVMILIACVLFLVLVFLIIFCFCCNRVGGSDGGGSGGRAVRKEPTRRKDYDPDEEGRQRMRQFIEMHNTIKRQHEERF